MLLRLGAPLRVSLVPRTQTLRPGDYLRLICNVQNSHTTDIEWSKEQGFVSPHAIVRQNTLEIVSVTASDAGHYRCQATDVRLDQVADALAEVILLGQTTPLFLVFVQNLAKLFYRNNSLYYLGIVFMIFLYILQIVNNFLLE